MSRKADVSETEGSCLTPVSEKVYRAAVYVRLSVEDNSRIGDKESIATQQYMLEKYIEVQPDMRLQGVYCDNGETGTDFDRPGFEHMMNQVRKREIDCIVVKDLSRFGRSYVETGYYLEKIFPYLGVRFVAVNDDYDTLKDSGGNEMVLSLKNLVNDLYARDISRKIVSSLNVKRKNGEYIGAFPPYGYMKSPEDKHKLMIDPEAAAVVRDIFRWRKEGVGVGEIVRKLNEKGIPSPSLYYYRKGYSGTEPSATGRLWKVPGVRKMIGNPVYVGQMVQGKTRRSLSEGIRKSNVPCGEWIVVEHTHMPIIDRETFYKVQELAGERCRQSLAIRGRQEASENIFKGLLVCGECGKKMVRHKSVSTRGTARYAFVCGVYEQNRGRQGCTKKYVRERDVQEAVCRFLSLQVEMGPGVDEEMEQGEAFGWDKALRWGRSGRQEKELDHRICHIQQKIRHNKALRGNLYESLCDGILSKTEYRALKAEYDRNIMELDEEMEELQRESQKCMKRLSFWKEWFTSLREGGKEKAVTRTMALEFIQSIRVSGCSDLEIIWNFQDKFITMAGL